MQSWTEYKNTTTLQHPVQEKGSEKVKSQKIVFEATAEQFSSSNRVIAD